MFQAPVAKWWVAAAVGLVAIVLQMVVLRSRGTKIRSYLAKVDRDLARRVVDVEWHEVEAVKVLREPERGAFFLCVRLSDRRNLFVCDCGSFSDDEPQPHPSMTLRRNMRFMRYPCSGAERYDFIGDVLPYPPAVALLVQAQDWPEYLAELPVAWDKIEQWAARGLTVRRK